MKTIVKFSGKFFVLSIIQVVALFMLTGCSKSSDMYPNPNPNPVEPGANEVFIQNMAFSPQTLNVNVNTTVIWTNKAGISHTVTSSTGLFDSGPKSNGGTFSFQFTSTGTFNYYCTIHPEMTGSVIVH